MSQVERYGGGATRRARRWVLLVVIAAGAAGGCARHGKQARSAVAARVNGKAIPMDQIAPAGGQETARPGPAAGVAPARAPLTTRQRLDAAIDEELLLQESQKLAVPDLEDRVEKRATELASAMPAAPGKHAPAPDAATRERIRRGILVDDYLRAHDLLDPPVSDEEIAHYYAANKKSLTTPETRHVKHVLVQVARNAPQAEVDAALAKITAVRKAVLDGRKSFEEAARESSDCSTARIGGDLGDIKAGYMPKAFTDVAFELPDGQVSDVVRTQHGFHVMKVVGRSPEKLLPLAEARDFIARYLKSTATQRNIAAHVAQLRSKARIEVYLN